MLTNSMRRLVACAAILGGVASCAPDAQRPDSAPDQASEPGRVPKLETFETRPLPGVVGANTSFEAPDTVAVSTTGRYFVHFTEAPVAGHFGELRKRGTSAAGQPLGARLRMGHPALASYKQKLVTLQRDHLARIAQTVGRSALRRSYTTALNAAVLEVSHEEATRIAKLEGVAFVEPDQELPLLTDRGPKLVGAPAIWDGSASGVASKGEGMVVGIIDTGIAFNVEVDGAVGPHPSFKAVAEDGYTHVNPLGEGVYLGGCKDHPEWCSSKLIGVYDMLVALDGKDPGAPSDDVIWGFKDLNGHGSHVASTVAGNPLARIPLIDADGKPSNGFFFENASGVAPRANIISYKVCAPSCATSNVVAAVEQAIEDGIVDVINHSIGSETGSPWRASKSLAFLRAREAGIFVASAAGNEGPAPATGAYVGSAPWTAGVAATTHDRAYQTKGLVNLSGGDTAPPATVRGFGLTGAFTGRIVYAGNFKVGAAGEPNFDTPELCLAPFPAGTFAPDMIVLCNRGVNARTNKGQNVRAGGAGGLIMANVTGGAASVDPDPHVIPAINVDAATGNLLKTWLATGTGHTGTIEASPPATADLNAADIMADFSSRGPYTGFDFLGPRIAAPGVNIVAAGSAVSTATSVPGLFGVISGTSMASPHLAGVATLLKAVRPSWSDAEVLSALVTTGKTTVRKEDRRTPADVHDMGGGRVQLDKAVRVGLLLDETIAGFLAGNPATGGDPGQLNVAELVRQNCVVECGWKRTVKAVAAGTWTVTGPAYIKVTPATFTLEAGASQVLDIQVDARTLAVGAYAFGNIVLTPASSELSEQHIPTVVKPSASNLPTSTTIVATRSQGSSAVRAVKSIAVDALTFKVAGLAVPERSSFEVAQDSNNASAYDDVTDGIVTKLVPFPDNAERLVVEILDTESTDLDLRVGVDKNGDGKPSQDEQYCAAATSSALERCEIDLGGTLTAQPQFWIAVQNWQASEPDAVDSFTLAVTLVGSAPTDSLTVTGPTGPLAALTPWDLTFNWKSPANVGDLAYGKVRVYRQATQSAATLLGTLNVRLVRAANDVSVSLPTLVKANEAFPVTLNVGPNYDEVARNYRIEVPLPTGVSYVAGSGGSASGNRVVVEVAQPAKATASVQATFQVRAARSLGGSTVQLTATNTVDNPNSVAESASASVTLSRYAFSGFLFPTPPNSTMLVGLPVILQFQVREATTNRALRGLVVGIEVKNEAGEVVHTSTEHTEVFGTYFHSFGTGGFAPGRYTVTAKLDDGTSYAMTITLRRLFGR